MSCCLSVWDVCQVATQIRLSRHMYPTPLVLKSLIYMCGNSLFFVLFVLLVCQYPHAYADRLYMHCRVRQL